MKDSRNANVETAFEVGATTATLLKSGTIASGAIIADQVEQLGTTTELTVCANRGAVQRLYVE